MSRFTDWFSVNIFGNLVNYVIGWYEYLAEAKDTSDNDYEDEWG